MTKVSRGSFRALRDHHLPLFDEALRRHDRGWPHPPAETPEAKNRKWPWKTFGIVHYRPDEDEAG